jgi:DNA (cytosine-5)-methyltransferase 1
MNKLRVLELFGGIGACSKALERLGIDYEIADYVEIDKYAVKSFNAIHNTNFEPQDITQWNKDIEVDLIMHGSPCQDFSLAGLQAGGDEGSGTRSSLMYETIRIVKKLKPKYVIWENVKNLLSKKHRHNFDSYLEIMESLGYKNYYQVLNAKDYGIPQNRERVFTISIRNDIDKEYIFPEKQELKLKLKDMLEDNVDEKYYLSDKMIKYISATGTANFRNPDCKINLDIARPLTTDQNKRAGTTNYLSNDLPDNYDLNEVNKVGHIPQWHQRGGIYDENGLAPTICATDYKTPKLTTIKIKNATKKGYIEASDGDSVNLAYPDSKTRRGRVGEQVSQTLQCNDSMGVIEKNKYSEESLKRIKQNIIKNDIANTLTANAMQSFNHNNCALINNDLRIRKLTPKECWRLMGFDDEDFEKASQVNSNAQLYKQAGNSIVVNVLMAIFNELLKKEGE